ncbi:DNA helicase II [Sulfuriferula sp. AH1]|uniref:UvrD-helicase domain-containing protein n=1 Tax=Sulfuriferula sp. AH1 TaxID=1985873 RepID=UPI000B3B6E43|nr:UvrD-helicase domain-containing protein [Sulfuriferula sp. AH1]ARU30950.1 DNA helicase II [Sulfuriferula sp. AH1]
MSSLLDGLNPEQLAAVTLPHQSALILAGAGSGKTRVLTTRIAWLLQTGQVSPLGILAVTFTNKAAKEMQTRLSSMLPINTRGMWIGTFHGLANRLLRTHHHEAGLPQLFQILDSADQLSAIKRLLKSMNVDTEKFEPKKVQNFINGNKDAGLRAHHVDVYDPYTRRLVEFYSAYDEQCNREGVVDFAELLLRSEELLARNEALRRHYQERFRYILVDEFQDTNRLQYRWLKHFAGADSALMAVGDDDQSIYAFRGAHTGNMNEFQRDYAHDNIIKLEQNYRSHGNILDAANALISQNPARLGKNLWTAADQGELIRVYLAYNDQEEARFIAEESQALHREGIALNDMAVLYRSNAQSRVLEHALFSAGIPYKVYGGLRFFERQEIKHALAYLRLLANPDDDGAFTRVVNFPTRGIGARSLEQLIDAAQQSSSSLWHAASTKAGDAPGSKGLPGFVQLIRSMQEATLGVTLPEAIEHILQASGLMAHYLSEKDGQDRVDNLNELINAATVFINDPDALADAADNGGLMASFLAHAALEAGVHQAGEGHDALQLMTVHAAKGLEFHAVFLTGLVEGLFPSEQSIGEQSGIEEERRLMYVAITRARRRLYISHAQSRMLHGQTRYGIPSRFLGEIPMELLKPINKGYAPDADVYAAPVSRSTQQHSSSPWRMGMSVRHAKFGVGVVINVEGQGPDTRVQINFGGAHGVKWLALEYAKLEAA